ncbi:hypothetical protein B0T26DRAFT_677578 [Lasiosphaeria miniovina]|uniref:Uncharacterized protein n=1 Tax=Lasiosphaeria miniovina TaxID=1954250 RepID=A0AA40ACF8_9PEZI|nr:uncharacterized protein B0T26DRAFT_677578 [Lasiosphaeria miniovina]KAK0713214.1 hypothetical protein B0T26DRAFT_677578 [Lasiosphaeria miniovina]
MESPSIPPATPLCPLDDRRSAPEFYVSFFAVSFTALAFFFKTIQQQEGRLLSWNVLLFYLAPLGFVFKYAIALLGIFGVYSFRVINDWAHGRPGTADWDDAAASLQWLFGKVGPEQQQQQQRDDRSDYEPLPADDTARRARRRHSLEAAARTVGKLLAALLFLVQCSGTIFLHGRRIERDAVATIDQKTFELACAGLLIGVVAVGQTLRFGAFGRTVPDASTTRLNRFALFWRGGAHEKLAAFQLSVGMRFWTWAARNLLPSAIILGVVYREVLAGTLAEFLIIDSWQTCLVTAVPFFVSLCVLLAVAPFTELGKDMGAGVRLSPRLFVPWWLFYPLLAAAVSILSPVVLLDIVAPVMEAMLAVLVAWPGTYVYSFWEVSALSQAPQDSPCPLLWSDPVSQYILWLA